MTNTNQPTPKRHWTDTDWGHTTVITVGTYLIIAILTLLATTTTR